MSTQDAGVAASISELDALLGDRLSTSEAVLEQHGHDEFWQRPMPPDAVVFPQSTEEVVEIVKVCARDGTPVIPYGTGTAVEGHVQAVHGGVCIDVSRMNEILRVSPEDLDCTVQPGVTRKQLNVHLRDSGLHFPVDPGADASLGGMTATNASGTNAVRYGTMRDNVLSMKAVLPNGEVIRTSSRARKSSAGYDLTRLFVGSEGTLGVITEVTLKLYGIPEAISAAVAPFESIEGAVDTAIEIIQSGIPIARMELLDEVQLAAVNDYSGFDYPVKPTLFLEFNGTEVGVAEQVEMAKAISQDHGGGDYAWSSDQEERNKLWQARHDAAYAVKALRPGAELWGTDVCVPLSRLTECVMATKKDLEDVPFPVPILGHVGDGNFHLIFVINVDDEEEVKLAHDINDRMIRRAIEMEGTSTGEHGIGMGKTQYLRLEHGGAVDVMAAVKKSIDPGNIMNPGKVLEL